MPIKKSYKRRSIKSGLLPGTLVHIGERPANSPVISSFYYDASSFREEHFQSIADYTSQPVGHGVSWVNVEGVHDTEMIRFIGGEFDIHPLALEDIVNTVQRSKIEDYGNYLFIVLRMLKSDGNEFNSEQLSMIIGNDFILTFQEGLQGDLFDEVRDRIRNNKGKIRSMGSDYLCYSLVDAIVDGYFSIIEGMGERIADLEEELTITTDHATLHMINAIKKEIIFLRKTVWPVREVVSFLERGDTTLITDATRIYFRDIYDHTIQVIDTVETYRDLLSGMLDLYLSSVSNRTNEIMKFLTVIGTIFMPLTFLVGVYGMNFKNMPELEWHYGYFVLLVLMLLLSLLMVLFFRKKRWL